MRDGWRQTVLGEVTTFATGYSFPERYQGKRAGRWPFLKVSDMNAPGNGRLVVSGANWVDEEDLSRLRARPWPAGTVVFPKVGAALLTEKRRLLAVDACFDNNVMGLVPGPLLLPEYLLAFMETVRLGDIAQMGALPSINQSHVANVPVVVPSLAEQRRIVDLIRAADDHATECRRLSSTATAVYHALLDNLFRDESAGGPLVPLGDVASTRLGKMLDAKRLSGRAYPYLANVNIQWDEVRLGGLKTVPLTDRERDELTLVAGDVLMCEGGEAGRTAVLAHDLPGVYFQKAVHRVRCGSMLRPRFLLHFMRYASRNGVLDEFLSALTIQHLTGEKLRRIPVPIPPAAVQDDAIATLDGVSFLARRAADGEAATGSAKRALLADLLSASHEIPASYDRLLDATV